MATVQLTPADRADRPRTVRFSLLALILLVMVAGPFTGWVAPHIYRYVQSHDAPSDEEDLDAALMWLKKHQLANGSWSFEHWSPKPKPMTERSSGVCKHAPTALTGAFLVLSGSDEEKSSDAVQFQPSIMGLPLLPDNDDDIANRR